MREAIEKLYADDFDRFGDAWDFSRVEKREMQWTAESFAHVRSIVEANERIADLARTARRLASRTPRCASGSRHLRAQQAAPAGVRSLPRRVVRRLRGH